MVRRFVLFVILVALACAVTGCGLFGGSQQYSVVLLHGDEEDGQMATIRATMDPHAGPSHVFVGQPAKRRCRVWAKVYDDAGQLIEGAEVKWVLDPDAAIASDGETGNTINIVAKSSGPVGPAKVIAQYADVSAEIVIHCYGWFTLECEGGEPSSGWSMDSQGPGDDLAVSYDAIQMQPVINAPYGIARLADPDVMRDDAFFEQFSEPPAEGHANTATGAAIYDIISSSGTHYKLALGMITYSSSTRRAQIGFGWDYYR